MPLTTEAMLQNELLVGSRFTIEFGKQGKPIENVTDVGGLSNETATIDVQQITNKGQVVVTKTAGNQTYSEISVKRKLTADKTMWDWVKKIRDRNADHFEGGSIILYSFDNKPIAQWDFLNAWPSKWSIGDLDAGTDDTMTEELTVQVEHLIRKK